MKRDLSDLKIVDNEHAGQWEAQLGDDIAVAQYQQRNDTLVFTHTEVPSAFEGQGVASRLVKTALDSARERNLAVIPYCPFVAAYIRRHDEYASLVPEQYRSLLEDRRQD